MRWLLALMLSGCVRTSTQNTPVQEKKSRLDGEGVRITSDYSTIIVRDEKDVRTMYFVRDNGDLAWESSVNIKKPSL